MLEKFSLRTKTHSLMLWSQCSHHDVWTWWLWSALQEPYQPPAWQGRRQKSPPLFPRLFSTACCLSHSWLHTFLASFLQSLPLVPFSCPSSITAITKHYGAITTCLALLSVVHIYYFVWSSQHPMRWVLLIPQSYRWQCRNRKLEVTLPKKRRKQDLNYSVSNLAHKLCCHYLLRHWSGIKYCPSYWPSSHFEICPERQDYSDIDWACLCTSQGGWGLVGRSLAVTEVYAGQQGRISRHIRHDSNITHVSMIWVDKLAYSKHTRVQYPGIRNGIHTWRGVLARASLPLIQSPCRERPSRCR